MHVKQIIQNMLYSIELYNYNTIANILPIDLIVDKFIDLCFIHSDGYIKLNLVDAHICPAETDENFWIKFSPIFHRKLRSP